MADNIIDTIKKQLANSRRMMESGLEEEPKPVVPKPKQDASIDMSSDAIKKRDAEYRKKGWIK